MAQNLLRTLYSLIGYFQTSMPKAIFSANIDLYVGDFSEDVNGKLLVCKPLSSGLHFVSLSFFGFPRFLCLFQSAPRILREQKHSNLIG